MNDGMAEIIAQLERKKSAIDKALAALRDVDEVEAPAPVKAAKRKGGMTPEGRRRLSEAMKRRWAARNGELAVKATRKKRAAKKAA